MSVMLIDPRHAADLARRYRTWRDTFVGDAADYTWEFCATCWGTGRYLSPARNGEGLVPVTCRGCGGLGQVPT